ncbi:hypothetical protein SDC9_139849 [bioreactor metagenome]|uniref:Uncharacterized protein n=1 Tax=bioreactor metagenome TaxID=1076179 RepID=A0A645DVT4_9ZZZZ|nr:hypothetical protein [Proteiniclasticum sp. QWL-01]UUM13205.1 hypothetical protein NQU17_06520 [Clostridiaceae bacterium HFYG-1003]WFF71631.1 hypothetical protein P6M73_09930 [Proteiniclasticum sp. QWL-01]
MEAGQINMEVIAEFIQGRIIPRRIRYYDLASAEYRERDIRKISYEMRNQKETQFGIEFSDTESAILNYSHRTNQWRMVEHL